MSDTMIYAHPRVDRIQHHYPNNGMMVSRPLVVQQYRWLRRSGISARRARAYLHDIMFIGSVGRYVRPTNIPQVLEPEVVAGT